MYLLTAGGCSCAISINQHAPPATKRPCQASKKGSEREREMREKMDGQLEREVGSESEGLGNAEGMQPDMVTWKK